MSQGLVRRLGADLRAGGRQAFALHLCMQLVGVALFAPLLGGLVNRLAYTTGDRVVTNFDIAGLLLSPLGLAAVLLFAALTIGLLFAEFAGLTWIAGHAIAGRPVSLLATLAAMSRRLPAILWLATHVFLRLVLLLLPFAAVAAAYWFTQLAGRDINYYLAEDPPEWRRAKLLLLSLGIVYALLAAWRLARWLFAIPAMLYEKLLPRRALGRSDELIRGRLLRVLTPLAGFWLLLTAVALALALLGREISDAALDLAGIEVRKVLPIVAASLAVSILYGFLYGAMQLSGHQFLVTRMYAEHVEPGRRSLPALDEEPHAPGFGRFATRLGLAVLALAVGTTAWLLARLELRSDVEVTAHRGAALVAPENSMAAFRAAIDAGADYIELDVQRTADGALAVVHDGDLLRMAGDPRKVRALAAADLAGIDIGSKRNARFAGESVPRLEEVIELARGRIRLNVELKYNVPDPTLAPAVVELLRREEFLDQAVITSLDYAALKQVEAIEPNLPTGHIVTASLGDVARTEADFVSLNSARATPALLRRAHAAGKEVHVWTVNDPEVMVRMIERGVDNVITDDPALLRRIMRDRSALSEAEILGLRLRVLFERPPPELTSPEAVPEL
jgi:glycerophosphoryl diester phosphodiesterase